MPVEQQGSHYVIPIWDGLLEEKHWKRMGQALWLYLWCIKRQTSSFGHVLYGKPILAETITKELGPPSRTIRRWLIRLKAAGYLSVIHMADGYVIRVLKPKKKAPGRSVRNVQGGQECPTLEGALNNSPAEGVDNSVPGQKCPGPGQKWSPTNVDSLALSFISSTPFVDNSQDEASKIAAKVAADCTKKLVQELANSKSVDRVLGKEPGDTSGANRPEGQGGAR